jgi:hypothetical protein
VKTSEVFKELEINPNKIFEMSIRNGYFRYELKRKGQYFNITCYNKDGSLVEEHMAAGRFNGNINIDADWQEVKQPVTWQEAIEALTKDKKDVFVDIGGGNGYHHYGYDLDYKFLPEEFSIGKWYIQ